MDERPARQRLRLRLFLRGVPLSRRRLRRKGLVVSGRRRYQDGTRGLDRRRCCQPARQISRLPCQESLLPSPNRSRLLPTSVTLLSGRTLAIARFGWGGVGGGGRAMGHRRRATPRPPTPTLPHKGGGRSRCRLRGLAVAPLRRLAVPDLLESRLAIEAFANEIVPA